MKHVSLQLLAGQPATILCADVQKIREPGLSKGANIAIGAGRALLRGRAMEKGAPHG